MDMRLIESKDKETIKDSEDILFLLADDLPKPYYVIDVPTPQGNYVARKFLHPETQKGVFVITHADIDKKTDEILLFEGIGNMPGAALLEIYSLCNEAIVKEKKGIRPFQLPEVLQEFAEHIRPSYPVPVATS